MEPMTVVFSLLIVVLSGGGTTASKAREFPTLDQCQVAEAAAHDAAKRASGVIDVGTICVETKFEPGFVKPRA